VVIEADELWSVVGGKRGVWWVWVALDADTWQVVGRVATWRPGEVGLTNHIERFGCTLRPRCARFARKPLSFSTCPRNYLGALWYFTRLDNAS
jgi:IS1 family transposase